MLPKDLAVLILSYFKFSTIKNFTTNIKLLSSICNVTESNFTKTNLGPINRALELMALTGVRIETDAIGLINPLVSAALALEQKDQQLWLQLKPDIAYYFSLIIGGYKLTKNEQYWITRLFNTMDFSQFRGLISDNADALTILILMVQSQNIDLFEHSLVFYTNRPVGSIDLNYYKIYLTSYASISKNINIINILIEHNLFDKRYVANYLNDDISKLALSNIHYDMIFYADIILNKRFNLITNSLDKTNLERFAFCLLILGYWDRAVELIKTANISVSFDENYYVEINLLAFLNGKIKPPPANWFDSYHLSPNIITTVIIIIAGRLNLPNLIDKLNQLNQFSMYIFEFTFLTFSLAVAQKLQPYVGGTHFVVSNIENQYDQIYNFQTVSYFINQVTIESLSSFTIDQILELTNSGNDINIDYEAREYLTNLSFLPTLYQPYLGYDDFVNDISNLVNSIPLFDGTNLWLLRQSLANFVGDQQDVANNLQSIGTSEHLKQFSKFNNLNHFTFNPNHPIRDDLKNKNK